MLEPNNKSLPSDILYFRFLGQDVARKSHGHKGVPWRLLYSPDGMRLVSCGDDGTIRLWDAKTGDQVAKFEGCGWAGGYQIWRGECVAFSPNGKWLATFARGTVSFRRPSDGGETIAWLPTRQNFGPLAIRFSPDSKSLFAFGGFPDSEQKSVKFVQFDLSKGERKFESTRAAVDGILTPDGKYVITWNGSPEVSFWDIGCRNEIKVLSVAPKALYDVTLSPTGNILATAGDDGKIKFWDVATRSQRSTKLSYSHEEVDFVRFSPDGRYLVTASDDGWLRVWDAPKFAWVPMAPFIPGPTMVIPYLDPAK